MWPILAILAAQQGLDFGMDALKANYPETFTPEGAMLGERRKSAHAARLAGLLEAKEGKKKQQDIAELLMRRDALARKEGMIGFQSNMNKMILDNAGSLLGDVTGSADTASLPGTLAGVLGIGA